MRQLPNLDGVSPVFHVHAHNDNEQPNPLFRSLLKGVGYIEVDLWLKNGILYAQHGRPFFTNSNKKFTTNYLDPLFAYFQKNGSIFNTDNAERPLTLVLDVKTDAAKTYQAILEVLKPYQSMLTYCKNNKEITNSVSILLSGHASYDIVNTQPQRWVQVDGRIPDLSKNYSASMMPTISEKYSKVVGWYPFSSVPNERQLEKIQSIADQVHAEGKLFRLWKIPENQDAVKLILESGVDIVSLDDLELS